MIRTSLSLLPSLCLLWSACADATVFTVAPDGTGMFPTIQGAVGAAEDGDAIELLAGVFTGPGNRDVEFMGKAITIRSQNGDPETTIIDCEGSADDPHRGFSFSAGEGPQSVLERLTVRGGYAVLGGAVRCSDASPTIRGCVFKDNDVSYFGGALSVSGYNSGPRLVDCLFHANRSGSGGAVFVSTHSSVQLEACTFACNEGWYGGAIYT